MNDQQFTFTVGISERGNKHKQAGGEYSANFYIEKTLTIQEFINYIENGHSFCNVLGGRASSDHVREKDYTGEGFVGSNYIFIDADGIHKDGEERLLTKEHRFDLRQRFARNGICPTFEYRTFSSTDGDERFRFVWIFNERISDYNTFRTLSDKVNAIAYDTIHIPMDECNKQITRMVNGTDKKCEAVKDCDMFRTYSIDTFVGCADSITISTYRPNPKKAKAKRESGERDEKDNLFCKAFRELEEKGLDKFVEDNRWCGMIYSNKEYGIEREHYIEHPIGYEQFWIPTEIKNGLAVRKRLKDGDHRRDKIFAWAGTLSKWMIDDETKMLMGFNEWKRRFLYVICVLIQENMEYDDLDATEIATTINNGYRRPYDGGVSKSVTLKKQEIREDFGVKGGEEYMKLARRIAPKFTAERRKSNVLSQYDFNKTIEANLKEINERGIKLTKKTLITYMNSEGITYTTDFNERFDNERELIESYVKENKQYGVSGVWRLMESEKFPYKPKSKKTLYNVFERLGLDKKGTEKVSAILNGIDDELDSIVDRVEKVEAKGKRHEKKLNWMGEEITANADRARKTDDAVSILKRELMEKDAEIEDLKNTIALMQTHIEESHERELQNKEETLQNQKAIATLNCQMVDCVDRVGTLEEKFDTFVWDGVERRFAIPRAKNIF